MQECNFTEKSKKEDKFIHHSKTK